MISTLKLALITNQQTNSLLEMLECGLLVFPHSKSTIPCSFDESVAVGWTDDGILQEMLIEMRRHTKYD